MKYTQVRIVSTVSGTIVHILLVVLLAYKLEWGWHGVCIASSMNFVARDVSVAIYLSTLDEMK